MDCIRNDSKVELNIKLRAHEFTWNCPSVQQPDFGVVYITYTPLGRIVETKSLKFYLQKYRYKNAFNEELTTRILMDFLYYVQPRRASVSLVQNSRGGIENTCEASWDFDKDGVEKLRGYKPKSNFRGGWPMIKKVEKKHVEDLQGKLDLDPPKKKQKKTSGKPKVSQK